MNVSLKTWCVRFAEDAGWLFNVRDEIVASYLKTTETSSRLSRRRYSSPSITLAVLASAVFCATCLVATYPAFQTPDIWLSQKRDAISLYSQLVALQGTINARSDVPPPSLQDAHAKSRMQLATFVLRVEDAQPEGNKRLTDETRESIDGQFETISQVLRLEPSVDNTRRSNQQLTPTQTRTSYQFALQEAAAVRSTLAIADSMVVRIPPSVYAYADSPRLEITRGQALSRSDNFPALSVSHTSTRLPVELRGWKGFVAENGEPFALDEVIRGESIASVAGGITFANKSSPHGDIDLNHYILTYDFKDRRLVLVGPGKQLYRSISIDPQSLKALDAFVRSGQSIAVSVGWNGANPVVSQGGQTVLLDPAFVDTELGQDLVRADSLPWEFRNQSLSGWTNPMATEFRVSYEGYTKTFLDDLRRYLIVNQPTEQELSDLLTQMKAKPELYRAKLKSCDIEPSFLVLIARALLTQKATQEEVLYYIQERIFHRVTLATLYDKDPLFSLQADNLLLSSKLDYRYITSKIEYGETVRFGKCLEKRDVEPLKKLDNVVNGHIDDIVSAFPAVRKMSDYASVAAFLRWAREPGHLQAVDFYSLIDIQQHDPKNTPTPDFIR
jgi:hypothetical protein